MLWLHALPGSVGLTDEGSRGAGRFDACRRTKSTREPRMTLELTQEVVNIRPGVSILSVLRHLNYKPWYAIAEFVDNAIQSYLDHSDRLKHTAKDSFVLKVSIEIDPTDSGRIVVRDNAAGIHEQDYERAFRTAAVPLTRDGLSEFGMGMKSAACWFARRWQVRTKALGESLERTISFDITSIVQDEIEQLEVQTRPASRQSHYTEIILYDLHHTPQKRTIGKIKEHLGSIYRIFLRKGELELTFNREPIEYNEPVALQAPYYKTPAKPPVEWEKRIDIDLGDGRTADGWAALLARGSTSEAGFALFRRNRLIQGSGDEGYRPAEIFGASNSFTYQRLFGELHLEGFGISHTKDGIQWGDAEDRFLDLLKQQLDTKPLPLLDQAEGFRVRRPPEQYRSAAEIAIRNTAETIEQQVPRVMEQQIAYPPQAVLPPSAFPPAKITAGRVIHTLIQGRPWDITLELSEDPAVGDWVSYFDSQPTTEILDPDTPRRVGVRVSMAHPFMERFGGTFSYDIEPLVRVAVALVLSEVTAREAGIKFAGEIRRRVNELLREALCQP